MNYFSQDSQSRLPAPEFFSRFIEMLRAALKSYGMLLQSVKQGSDLSFYRFHASTPESPAPYPGSGD